MYCPSCGEEVAADSAFCSHCGTDIGGEIEDKVDEGEDRTTETTPSNLWWLGLLISPLAVLAGFVFGFWVG